MGEATGKAHLSDETSTSYAASPCIIVSRESITVLLSLVESYAFEACFVKEAARRKAAVPAFGTSLDPAYHWFSCPDTMVFTMNPVRLTWSHTSRAVSVGTPVTIDLLHQHGTLHGLSMAKGRQASTGSIRYPHALAPPVCVSDRRSPHEASLIHFVFKR